MGGRPPDQSECFGEKRGRQAAGVRDKGREKNKGRELTPGPYLSMTGKKWWR